MIGNKINDLNHTICFILFLYIEEILPRSFILMTQTSSGVNLN